MKITLSFRIEKLKFLLFQSDESIVFFIEKIVPLNEKNEKEDIKTIGILFRNILKLKIVVDKLSCKKVK